MSDADIWTASAFLPKTSESRRARSHEARKRNIETQNQPSYADIWAAMTPLDKAALMTTPVPVVGDAAGLVADIAQIEKNPSWSDLALIAAGLIPIVPNIKGLKRGYDAAQAIENAGKTGDITEDAILSSKRSPGYNPPKVDERPFEADYPEGAPLDDRGNLTHDIEGRPLTAPIVAGKRTYGPDHQLTRQELDTVAESGTGRSIAYRSHKDLGGDAGQVVVDRRSGKPSEVLLREGQDEAGELRTLAHEDGHVLDILAGRIDKKGIKTELRDVYHQLNNRSSSSSAKPYGPEVDGYKGPNVDDELMAEAIRAYMQDPNWLKSVAPKTAARIRKFINSNPDASKIIQFNSLGGAAAGGSVGALTLDEILNGKEAD